jgi:hypothetical protein
MADLAAHTIIKWGCAILHQMVKHDKTQRLLILHPDLKLHKQKEREPVMNLHPSKSGRSCFEKLLNDEFGRNAEALVKFYTRDQHMKQHEHACWNCCLLASKLLMITLKVDEQLTFGFGSCESIC